MGRGNSKELYPPRKTLCNLRGIIMTKKEQKLMLELLAKGLESAFPQKDGSIIITIKETITKPESVKLTRKWLSQIFKEN